MSDIQDILKAIFATGDAARKRYHASYGDLIDTLRSLDPDTDISTVVPGIDCYRGFYVDIAIVDNVRGDGFELPPTAGAAADLLEAKIGSTLYGYKGGDYEIARDKPLWRASDYGNCSDLAVVGFNATDGRLELVIRSTP